MKTRRQSQAGAILPRLMCSEPERHHAMTVQDGTGAEAGTVTQVFQKGYVLNQRLVRPAMVVVAR